MEPTKVCSRCTTRKPWSAFHNYYRHGEARPLSRCKDCDREHRKEWAARNRAKVLEHRRVYFQRIKADPERYGARLERERVRRRLVRGTDPRNHRTSARMRDVELGPAANLTAAPFGAWLRGLGMRQGEISQTTGIDDTLVSRLIADPPKQPYVSVDTVDRACAALGGDLGALYPEWACTA